MFKIILTISILFSSVLYSKPITMEVRKSVDSLPTFSIENGFNDTKNNELVKLNKKMAIFLLKDVNVLSIFNLERKIENIEFSEKTVSTKNNKLNYVLRFSLTKENKKYTLRTKLFSNNKLITKSIYRISSKNQIIFLSHNSIFDLNKYMGFEDIKWMKEKVILSKSLHGKRKRANILIADYTLSYQFPILKNGFNLFPKWADDNKKYFYYTKITENNLPQLRKHGIYDGSDKLILTSEGMIVCSDVYKDFSKILVTMSPYGQPDIYEYILNNKKKKRITKYSGIDVNGQYLNDKEIVFISDRLGTPNVFMKPINNTLVDQLIFNNKSNSSCTSFNDKIIYKSRETSKRFKRNTFNLHIISTKTSSIRRLTSYGRNEYPKFSKDGKTVLYIKYYKGLSSLNILRLDKNKSFAFNIKGGEIQSIDW